MVDRYKVTLTGITPLLMHRDNIDFNDELAAWRNIPSNKKLSVPGDDRSPAFTWLGCLYDDNGKVAIPSDNIMRCLMEGGASVTVGKGAKTFKSQTQSGMLTTETGWAVCVDGKTINTEDLFKLRNEREFAAHQSAVVDLGFALFVKRAKIGTSKHIRVRPKFPRWILRGHIDVWDPQITAPVMKTILDVCGESKGLGDWRPSSKTPGAYGRFTAEVEKV